MGDIMDFKKLFKKKDKAKAPKKIIPANITPETAREKLEADKKGEPWVKVLELSLSPDDPSKGFIELDWNRDFVRYLRENGYEDEEDEKVVDEWLMDLCKSIYANG